MPVRRGVAVTIAMPNTPNYDPLPSAPDDAGLLAGIARKMSYELDAPLTNPTVSTVRAVLERLAGELRTGDQLLLTFSGHGPTNSVEQGWELTDGTFWDAELFSVLEGFSSGVRVLLISDSCSSGTVAYPRGERYGPSASVISMAAAADGENAYADMDFGVFTRAIAEVWDDGAFIGTHRQLFDAAHDRARRMARKDGKKQTPVYKTLGDDRNDLEAFERARPFDLGSGPDLAPAAMK